MKSENKGGYIYETKQLNQKLIKKRIDITGKNATRKANAECWGFMYEPKVPKKLKKTICMMLVCILTIAGVLAGSTSTFKAAEGYDYRSWTTRKPYASSSLQTATVSLYDTDEAYEWAVTSYTTATGYGMVELYGINNDVEVVSGGNKLTEVGTRTFYRTNPDKTYSTYMQFGVTMSHSQGDYTATYSGYIKIIKGLL